MYLEHFRLQEKPFSLTPDTQYFLSTLSHEDALNTTLVALKSGEGFVKIVGEVGTGKTLLCRILLGKLHDEKFVTAYVPNPCLTPEELKTFIAMEIGAECEKGMQAQELTAAIYRKLMQMARQDKQVVLVIDEAQSMSRDTIEALRLLTNLETEKRKLLQIVMFGQPELDGLLARNDLRQLKQRIVFSEYLKPLSKKEVSSYIRRRLSASGDEQGHSFTMSACWFLWLASGGIPRLINILAHKAMLCAYGKGDTTVSAWHITKAIADTPESRMLAKALGFLWRLNGRWYLARPVGVA